VKRRRQGDLGSDIGRAHEEAEAGQAERFALFLDTEMGGNTLRYRCNTIRMSMAFSVFSHNITRKVIVRSKNATMPHLAIPALGSTLAAIFHPPNEFDLTLCPTSIRPFN